GIGGVSGEPRVQPVARSLAVALEPRSTRDLRAAGAVGRVDKNPSRGGFYGALAGPPEQLYPSGRVRGAKMFHVPDHAVRSAGRNDQAGEGAVRPPGQPYRLGVSGREKSTKGQP